MSGVRRLLAVAVALAIVASVVGTVVLGGSASRGIAPSDPLVGRWFDSSTAWVLEISPDGEGRAPDATGPCARSVLRDIRAEARGVYSAQLLGGGRTEGDRCAGRGHRDIELTHDAATDRMSGPLGSFVRSGTGPDAPAAGFLDGCDTVNAFGWARDDDVSGPVDVHLYADLPAGQGGTFAGSVTADQDSPDVGAHRFAFPHALAAAGGPRDVYAYAIGRNPDGSESGANVLLDNAPCRIPALG